MLSFHCRVSRLEILLLLLLLAASLLALGASRLYWPLKSAALLLCCGVWLQAFREAGLIGSRAIHSIRLLQGSVLLSTRQGSYEAELLHVRPYHNLFIDLLVVERNGAGVQKRSRIRLYRDALDRQAFRRLLCVARFGQGILTRYSQADSALQAK